MQTVLPCLLFGNRGGAATSSVRLEGGTDVPMAPPIAYMQHILLPMLRKLLGVKAELTVRMHAAPYQRLPCVSACAPSARAACTPAAGASRVLPQRRRQDGPAGSQPASRRHPAGV